MFDRFIPSPGCLCILQILGSVERPLAFPLGKTSAFLILTDDYLSRRTGLTKIRKRPVFYATTSGSDSNSRSSSSPVETIQKAANTVSGGTTAIVAPGKYDERVTV